MPPQLISLGIWALQQLITHEPEIAAGIKTVFTKADPTKADWDALHAKVATKSYASYVPASALPAAAPVSALTAEPVKVTVLPAPGQVTLQNLAVVDGSGLPAIPAVVSPQADKGPGASQIGPDQVRTQSLS